MNLSQLCWIATMVYGLHILEEYVLNWKDWAYAVTHIEVEWSVFLHRECTGDRMGIVCAEVAPTLPTIALAFPALMLINAVFFHIGGFLMMRGRFSPGLITAVLFFLPLGAYCYQVAWRSGAISVANLVESLLLGAGVMMSPLILLKLRTLPYFQQKR